MIRSKGLLKRHHCLMDMERYGVVAMVARHWPSQVWIRYYADEWKQIPVQLESHGWRWREQSGGREAGADTVLKGWSSFSPHQPMRGALPDFLGTRRHEDRASLQRQTRETDWKRLRIPCRWGRKCLHHPTEVQSLCIHAVGYHYL